jgi:endoglucanase
MKSLSFRHSIFILISLFVFISCNEQNEETLVLNELEYLEMPGLNVMLAHDFYPEGHQGGVSFIQNGMRVATNGDLRLEPTPGQWQPIPKVGERQTNPETEEIWVEMSYPDSSRHRKGFNPIIYPDLDFKYTLKVRPEGKAFRIIVDLEEPLPEEWIGKVGFNMEFFPGLLFGKSYSMDDQIGIFPLQANGPLFYDEDGKLQMTPLAKGNLLTIAPETESQRVTIENENGELELIDGRGEHNNGWFVVRSLIASGKTKGAVDWLVSPNVIDGWKHEPVIQISQVGYHPSQKKIAVIELDASNNNPGEVELQKIESDGMHKVVKKINAVLWGKFLRYNYVQFDFSDITDEGMYRVVYDGFESEAFQISQEVYMRHVWQPTLEYFLPVQMCHMRVNDRYRVWHGLCHMDDALMAPTDSILFDGYAQGPTTFTKYKSMDHVPGLDIGGWHDAGDYDLRVESQIGTSQMLSLALEEFNTQYDQTSIDQQKHLVEMHRPDGINDMLQQIEHGVLTVMGGYDALGRLYRGIICPTLRQYVMLGDAASMTDNLVYNPNLDSGSVRGNQSGMADDRLVFTEKNPRRELRVAAGLAAASRAMKNYNPDLSVKCLKAAENLWNANAEAKTLQKVQAATELLLTVERPEYSSFFINNTDELIENINNTGWMLGRIKDKIGDKAFTSKLDAAILNLKNQIEEERMENPYGVPYKPNIWGAGWGIQRFGVEQYYLHSRFPQIFPNDYLLHALNFVLGCHPGVNNASFASGVGAKSIQVAYGVNRADWSFIPGGVVSGTALIRPDFPELLEWPFLWQQTEYVLGGGGTNYMFLVLAADHLLNKSNN